MLDESPCINNLVNLLNYNPDILILKKKNIN